MGSQIALHSDIAPEHAIQDAHATQLLLKNGFDLYEINFNANEALLWAAAEDHEGDMVQLLLGKGAAVDAADEDGWTALHCAALNGHEATVRLLLEKGAAVDAADEGGWTALRWAARNGHEAIVQMLTPLS
jgi:ankyrin repeat protein